MALEVAEKASEAVENAGKITREVGRASEATGKDFGETKEKRKQRKIRKQ